MASSSVVSSMPTCKVMLAGSVDSGKADLLKRFASPDSSPIAPTYSRGIAHKAKIIDVDGLPMCVQLWDTEDSERFRDITINFLSGATAIILVFDVCSNTSFDDLQHWISFARKYSTPKVQAMLVANRCYSPNRVVPRQQAEAFAIKHNLLYTEIGDWHYAVDDAVFQLAKQYKFCSAGKSPKRLTELCVQKLLQEGHTTSSLKESFDCTLPFELQELMHNIRVATGPKFGGQESGMVKYLVYACSIQ